MPRSYTIGELGRRCGLSRSTLLYYDAIGLLVASGRSAANYRRYSSEDLERLERIRVYRQAGLALKDIQSLLATNSGTSGTGRRILERRLGELADEMTRLRVQQELLLHLLGRAASAERSLRQIFVGGAAPLGPVGARARSAAHRIRAAGADDHHRFLRFIGLSEAEARRVRALSAGDRSGA